MKAYCSNNDNNEKNARDGEREGKSINQESHNIDGST